MRTSTYASRVDFKSCDFEPVTEAGGNAAMVGISSEVSIAPFFNQSVPAWKRVLDVLSSEVITVFMR